MKLKYLISLVKTKIYGLLRSSVLVRFGFGSRIAKGVWNKEYDKNEWDFLFSEKEKVHYDAIIAQYKNIKTAPRILDIGCGHGALYHYFNRFLTPGFDYTGIDISQIAIEKASEKFPGINFNVVDYDFERLTGRFDTIVFNEVLYYFVNPIKIVQKAITENLSARGIVIISMYIDNLGKNEHIWKSIERQYKTSAPQVVSSEKGTSWTIKTIAVG
jgi:2-polyprenyl-3-methyl-5-hydroxy-6-metoxy-1,4-benzoquinol methylase